MLRTVLLGWEATCVITASGLTPTHNPDGGGNSIAFGIRAGSIDWNMAEEECGDSLFAQAQAFKPGRYHAAVSLEFYERSDISTTVMPPTSGGVPLGLFQFVFTNGGGYITGQDNSIMTACEIQLEIFPNGNTGNNKATWYFPSFVIQDYRDAWDMDGKLQATLSGKSNGWFRPPTN